MEKNNITREKAKKLRRNMSVVERSMWTLLQKRKLMKFKFRRQHPIPPYIVDFVCLSKKIIIEMDGEQHQLTKAYDNRRTKFLEAKGFKVLHIPNNKFLINGDEWIAELETIMSQ